MSDDHSRVNSNGPEGENPSPPPHPANVCPACGAEVETPAPDGPAALTGAGEDVPPPPRPLPDAVARMAAGLLVAPERAGPAGLPAVAGYEILAPLGRGGMGLV